MENIIAKEGSFIEGLLLARNAVWHYENNQLLQQVQHSCYTALIQTAQASSESF